jgi:hypothetical protein
LSIYIYMSTAVAQLLVLEQISEKKSLSIPEMSMAALPLPPPLPRRHRYGGSGAAAANFSRLSSR